MLYHQLQSSQSIPKFQYLHPTTSQQNSISKGGIYYTLYSIPIMWTRAAPMRGAGPWSPNHFVPCISVQPIQSRVPETPSRDLQLLASSTESSLPDKSAPWPAPRQTTGSQIHASSKDSRPPAKSAPWPAPRQATGSQIHASSKDSRPPAKSAPWPAPRQATGSQIHASSKDSRPPAKSAPWPAPRQATGSQIHASSKESRPPAKSAPWPAPRQATGSQIHASSKESRKTAGSQPEACITNYIPGPPREVSTSRILKASKPLRSILPQVQPMKGSLKSFLMKIPTSNTISSKKCAQKKHRLATSPCNLKSSLPVSKIFQHKLQQAAHPHHKIKHSTHHLYSNKELVTSTLYSSTSDDNHLQHSTSSPIMETSQSPSERCPNSCSANDVDYRCSPDSEKTSHSSMDDDTLDNSPTQYSYANSEASHCSLDSVESNPDSTSLSSESDILVEKQILPFPNLSRRCYKNEQRFYNILRDSRRRSNPVERDSDNVIISMNRSEIQGFSLSSIV